MRSRSLRARLTRAFALVVVLVLACAGLGLVAVTWTQNSVEKEVTLVQPMQLANLELRTAMIELSRGLRGYLLTRDERFLEAYDRGRHDLPDALNRLHGYAQAEDREYVRRQEELIERLSALYPDVRALGRGTAADTGQLLRGKELLDEFLAVNDTLARELAQEQERLEQATLDLRAAMVLVLASVAVLAGGIAVLTGLRTSRQWSCRCCSCETPSPG
ncbi:MAG: CHASE3 domain-containing protein [Actinomycetota bacterium]|nr:CHASE3 domain-containing protein [Actinomycetota bacterium]